MVARARRRREANRERKKRLELRRQKQAEATRIKHEGPSLAEVVREIVAERTQQLKFCAREQRYHGIVSSICRPFVSVAGGGFPQ